jgi:uncharacterized RDD family membrane protein YckC
MTYCTNCGAANQENSQFCTSCGQRFAGSTVPAVPQGSSPAFPPQTPQTVPPLSTPAVAGWPPGATYASWGDRAVGYLIDSVLVGAGMGVLYLFAGALLTVISGLGGHGIAGGMCCMMIFLFPVASLLVGIFNRVYLVATRGASIGQGVMRLRVVDSNGKLLTMGTAFIRLLAQVALSFVPVVGPFLDLLWPLWDERRQTLHDKAVGSYVLKL